MSRVTILFALIFTVSMAIHGEGKATEAKGLAVGTKAPRFKAIDADGKTFDMNKALQKGSIVLVFYRGQWCPVCNRHLKTLQDSLEQIEKLGAVVVAVTPEKPEYLNKMAKKTKATFPLLYDENYTIMDAYEVGFTPSATKATMYNVVLGANLKEAHTDDSQRLPVPATYIINKKGMIIWRQFDPDYHHRSTVKEIENALLNQ